MIVSPSTPTVPARVARVWPAQTTHTQAHVNNPNARVSLGFSGGRGRGRGGTLGTAEPHAGRARCCPGTLPRTSSSTTNFCAVGMVPLVALVALSPCTRMAQAPNTTAAVRAQNMVRGAVLLLQEDTAQHTVLRKVLEPAVAPLFFSATTHTFSFPRVFGGRERRPAFGVDTHVTGHTLVFQSAPEDFGTPASRRDRRSRCFGGCFGHSVWPGHHRSKGKAGVTDTKMPHGADVNTCVLCLQTHSDKHACKAAKP